MLSMLCHRTRARAFTFSPVFPWRVTYQIVKSEKYETFCVSKVIIWSQKMVAGVRYGNSLVVRRVSRRVSPGRINNVLLI